MFKLNFNPLSLTIFSRYFTRTGVQKNPQQHNKQTNNKKNQNKQRNEQLSNRNKIFSFMDKC